MPFIYDSEPHQRKHGPHGLERYQSYKDWLRDDFTFKCVYCLERERWYPSGSDAFGADHIKPKSDPQFEHLECDYANLVYCCNRCNSAKGTAILVDPCEVALAHHISVDLVTGEIVGNTEEGKLLIDVLGLDLEDAMECRREKILVLNLFQGSPSNPEVLELYRLTFGFPNDLPDLSKHTRTMNSKQAGIGQSYFQLKQKGELREVYGV